MLKLTTQTAASLRDPLQRHAQAQSPFLISVVKFEHTSHSNYLNNQRNLITSPNQIQ